jgi:hypothetical protein
MFKLRIDPFGRPAPNAVNPRYLPDKYDKDRKPVRFTLLREYSPLEEFFVAASGIISLGIWVALMFPSWVGGQASVPRNYLPNPRTFFSFTGPWDIFLLTAPLLLIGLIIAYTERSVARCEIQIIEFGTSLPILSLTRKKYEPDQLHKRLWYLIKDHLFFPRERYFTLAVRGTQNTVIERIKKYSAFQAPTKWRLLNFVARNLLRSTETEYKSISSAFSYGNDVAQAVKKYLMGTFPDKQLAIRSAKTTSAKGRIEDDLWPLCRLMTARILFGHRHSNETLRHPSDLPYSPATRDTLYFTYKLQAVYVASWVNLIALTLLLSGVSPSATGFLFESISYKIVCASLFFLWAIFALIGHRKLMANWKEWTHQTEVRPLGYLPIFLYRYDLPPIYRWEELDDNDFCLALGDALERMDRAFDLIVLGGVGIALALLDAMP